jgi:hypothetical protein
MTRPDPSDAIPAGKCACTHWARADEVTECRYCACTRHVARPHGEHDPQTPPGAEQSLQAFSDALEGARRELAAAADEEVDAELARDTAQRRAELSPDAPKVGVFDGVRTTVAMRAAWVAEQIAGEERTFRLATVKRKAAAKKLDILGKQGSFQQSIGRSVAASYQGQRGEGW